MEYDFYPSWTRCIVVASLFASPLFVFVVAFVMLRGTVIMPPIMPIVLCAALFVASVFFVRGSKVSVAKGVVEFFEPDLRGSNRSYPYKISDTKFTFIEGLSLLNVWANATVIASPMIGGKAVRHRIALTGEDRRELERLLAKQKAVINGI
jgi:hypothetical protein